MTYSNYQWYKKRNSLEAKCKRRVKEDNWTCLRKLFGEEKGTADSSHMKISLIEYKGKRDIIEMFFKISSHLFIDARNKITDIIVIQNGRIQKMDKFKAHKEAFVLIEENKNNNWKVYVYQP